MTDLSGIVNHLKRKQQDILDACQKANSTEHYKSVLTPDLIPAYVGQLAKERDHSRRLYQSAAEQATMLSDENKVMRELLTDIAEAIRSNAMNPTPVEEPSQDGPWLPCGLVSRIHEALNEQGARE